MAPGHGSETRFCLVTDRQRLAARVGGTADASACLVEQVAAAAAAGVDLVQLRERDLAAGELLQLAAACVGATRGTATRVVINDRLDVALAAGAAGVHLRGDSVASPAVRGFVPAGFLIGRSVHTVAEAIEEDRRGGADYLLLGTIFPTSSKPAVAEFVGMQALRQVTGAVTVPVLGIGGITDSTLSAVAASGAAGFAAIGWFIDAFLGAQPGELFRDRVERARRLFDTSRSIS